MFDLSVDNTLFVFLGMIDISLYIWHTNDTEFQTHCLIILCDMLLKYKRKNICRTVIIPVILIHTQILVGFAFLNLSFFVHCFAELCSIFGHCIVCPSNFIFWLPLWYLQTMLTPKLHVRSLYSNAINCPWSSHSSLSTLN